jgi:type II secretory ATPase GspE/PulE/Tfp pilus assembly ATPase PilB-like protein
MALHELLVVSDVVKNAMKKHGSAEVLREIAIPAGMRTLKMDGIAKVLAGQTDLKQVLQVCL